MLFCRDAACRVSRTYKGNIFITRRRDNAASLLFSLLRREIFQNPTKILQIRLNDLVIICWISAPQGHSIFLRRGMPRLYCYSPLLFP